MLLWMCLLIMPNHFHGIINTNIDLIEAPCICSINQNNQQRDEYHNLKQSEYVISSLREIIQWF